MVSPRAYQTDQPPDIELPNQTPKHQLKPILKLPMGSEHSGMEHEEERYMEPPDGTPNLLSFRSPLVGASRDKTYKKDSESRSPITPIKVPSRESASPLEAHNVLRRGDHTPTFEPGWARMEQTDAVHPVIEEENDESGVPEFPDHSTHQVSRNEGIPRFAEVQNQQEPRAEQFEAEQEDESEELESLDLFTVKEAPITMIFTKLAVAIIVACFWEVPSAIKLSSLLMCSDSVVFIVKCVLVILYRIRNKQVFIALPQDNPNLRELSFKPSLEPSNSLSMVPKVDSKDESLARGPQSLENIHRIGAHKSKPSEKNTKSFTAFHDKVVSNTKFTPANDLNGIQITDPRTGPKLRKQLVRELSLEALQASPVHKPRPILMNNQQRFHKIRSYSSDKIGTDRSFDRRAPEQLFNSHKWKTQLIEEVHSDQEGHRVSVNDFSPRLLLKDHKIRQMAPQSGSYQKESQHLQNEATKIHVLAAYFSMIDQLLLVSDSKMNILANNYSKPIFTRVVRRVQDRFDIDILTDTDDCHRLTDVFAYVPEEELRCGRDTLENLSRVFRLFDFSATKISKKEHYASKGVWRILEVLEKLCRGVKVQASPNEQVGQFKKFKDFNQITNSLRAINVKNGSVTTCRFSISEFILLIQEYLETLSNSRIRNFISDLNFTFIFMENVQLKIRLQPLEEKYYVFVVFENITDKVALGDANSRLNFSVSLINSLSHEMFTPLHHMQWVVEGLHQKIVGQNMAVACSRNQSENFKLELISDILVIKQFGMGLSMFVQNILDFANIVNNTFDLYYKKFRVKDLFEEILSIFSHKAKQKHITLEYEVADSLEMVSDYNRLAGLIFNFTDNSMKFTQKGGITLKAHLQEDTVVFRVVDTGVGIDEGDLKKICQFLNDPFLSEKTNDSAGIGIGLRMSQAILRQLTFGDTALFEIDSEKSQGTTIQFEIKQMKSTPNDRSTSSPQIHNLQVGNQQPFWQIQSPRFNMQMNALNLKEVQSDKVKTFIEERLKIHTMCKNQIDEEEDEDEHEEPEPIEQPSSAGLNRKTTNQVEQVRQKLQRIHSIEEKINSDDLNDPDSLPGKSPSKARNLITSVQDKFSDGTKPPSKTNKFVDEFTNPGERLQEVYKLSAELLSERGSGVELLNKPKSNRSPDLRQASSMEIGGGGEALDINSVLITPANGSNGTKQTNRVKSTVRRRTTLDGILEQKAPSMWNPGDIEIAQQIQTKKNAKRLISLSITHTPEPNARHSVKLSDHQSQERVPPVEKLSQGEPSPSAQPGNLNSLPEPLGRMSRTLSGSGRRIPPPKPEKYQKKVALVVDDEIMNTEIAKEIVARFGLEVFTASNGDLALEICYKFLSKKKRIDIIFMDFSMPGLRGDQVTAILRESRFFPILEQTPIIGLTAHNDSETKRKCLASGMNKVELKPFNVAKIRELLSEHGLVDPLANEDESEGRRAADLDLATK